MTILSVAAEVGAFLEELAVPYAIIGGLAAQHWGEPRFTRDVDVAVLAPSAQEAALLEALAARFQPRLPDALAFARRHRVLLLQARDGTPIDVSLAIPGYEEEVMRRAVVADLPGLRTVRLVSAEDLIIHKCVAGRPRDIEDVERVLSRQGRAIDRPYVRRWLRAFAPLVTTHEVLGLFDQAIRRVRSAGRRRRIDAETV
ncbi:MAG: nucleotidyl transferase AbiEii/AbiGii toxin family protein [Chloroflexi bacterium]|nr:nucleotidyl transferase AbiEii/AbiGii toxin family protein [Chloroflexota bacterium]